MGGYLDIALLILVNIRIGKAGVYIQRLQRGFSVNAGIQTIRNPGAGHGDWMFMPEIGVTITF